ncbi:hypothetical protein L861_08915 [Litchfieldella anticariensis FP35 = DSM 16096]|uniref:CopG family transcriptional regulator n=1 Tax=Litchfieldella anticariensis (strain DSM 16096 / CECT 5854 / CIP 108499 / LMG 22089 / FP35) TaxID=1121939 RepID=S2KKK9_LITA3|nr:hypothetical protein [Halomonas anticariensis]EPC02475.1 hypothetical protein L861_08915 [Halomonas anticariensis FP35 = DSM 16096]
MLNDTLKKRLVKDRPMTTVTLRVPVDVVESLKTIAPLKGFQGYQTLLKAYVSEGLRRDEAQYLDDGVQRLVEALKARGVPSDVIERAVNDMAQAH